MAIEFHKPKEFKIPDREVLAELSFDLFHVKQFGVELSIPVTIAALSKDFANGAVANLKLDDVAKQELHNIYYNIKMATFHCAWLGEVLFERLRVVNDSEFPKAYNQKVIEDFLFEKKKPYERLDFIGHKDLLCTILKNREKGKALPFYRKHFCGLFDDIIIQRNNFTHGKLFLLQTDAGYQTILHSDKGYHILDKDVMNSFNECYNELAKSLAESFELLKEVI